MRSLYAAVLLFISITTTVSAQDKVKVQSLIGDWRFNLGDNMKYARPEYDDSDWEKIYVPSNWHREGFKNYHGYAWYRRRVNLPTNENGELVLELGRIDDVDEVYLNGKLIGRSGSFPPDYYTAYSYARKYPIPKEYLNPNGKNVIAVRVFDEGGEGGILGSQVAIYSYKNFSGNTIPLFGRWRFKLGDDQKWAAENIDESDWEDVIAPATWESQGFEGYNGFAWYRKSFKLPRNYDAKDIMVILGKIDDLDEVYINGKLVGNTGKIGNRWLTGEEYRTYRNYHIPDGLLKAGTTNTIAVRVYDGEGVGGIYEGPLVMLPQNEYKDFWRAYKASSEYNNGFLSWLFEYFN